jgi:hypothetical protein
MKKTLSLSIMISALTVPVMAADLSSDTIKTNKQFSSSNVEGWFYTDPDATRESEKGHARMAVKDGNKKVELSFYRNSLSFRSTRLDDNGDVVTKDGRAVSDVIYVPTVSYKTATDIANRAAASKADTSRVNALQNQLTSNTNSNTREADARQAADSQLNGLVTTNTSSITTESDARQAADSQLNGFVTTNASSITIETDARQAADSQLNGLVTTNASSITTEADARQAADSQLNGLVTTNASSITTEADARQAADSQLNGLVTTNASSITTESDARQAADSQLNGFVTTNASSITTETDARQAADSQLNGLVTTNASSITTEADARQAADSQLNGLVTTNASSITTESDARQAADSQLNGRIKNNSKRIRDIEFQVQDLYSEVTRLDGAIAAATAVGSMVTPRYDGDTVISVGVGHYNDSSALAFGATHNITEHTALRFTVAGSDADNWTTPILGASANWAF